ncbi:histidine phosphatase family protein [Thalassotalea sp. LPB0316]|uniref:SixA phosphatase family protein n=1 Tax=Thalassotalea sp. LPB0316 TaxID=2769490 RepID=UPI001868CD7C|nr:histidine phosphatase family protein [Thalassotalea sp. LPB0316]QOL26029.1 histidine phosphatase family protein [Thalassotalea sp. LPB0316]
MPTLSAQEFTLYLTRHAEKQKDTENPSLTRCGLARAQQLAELLALANIEAVYSTAYNRTLETATPSANKHGLAIKYYSPKALDNLAIDLLNAKQNALIVGHSNTTPALASFLTGEELEKIDESQFRLLFQIRINGESRSITLLQQPLTCPQQ